MAQADLRRVERAARRSEAARTELQAAIIAAWKSGESYKDIAHAAGLSKARIGQIVKEDGRDR